MSGAKKIETVFDDQVSAKIQRKFDLVFASTPVEKKSPTNENTSMVFSDDMLEFNTGLEDELIMERNGKGSNGKGEGKEADAAINLDFSLDDEASLASISTKAAEPVGKTGVIDFDLDFNLNEEFEKPSAASAVSENSNAPQRSTLDDANVGMEIEDFGDNTEATQKTVMLNKFQLSGPNVEEFTIEKTGDNSSSDLMTSEEAKANIETTIKDILRPKFEDTKEIDLEGLERSGASDVEDSELTFREDSSKGFTLDDVLKDDAFSLETKINIKSPVPKAAPVSTDSTGVFDINDLDTTFDAAEEEVAFTSTPSAEVTRVISPNRDTPPSIGMGGSNMTTEDSMRFQATIRALREEREEMLAQIKNLKSDSKELEQDNLTLKANLDEAKIEITILRKRHMVEVEDLKYRLTMSDEKKAMADEKARQADLRREKLEQKVRIDFNQVKQREKELESKLELLSMDVDSQVQSREQKILELRRKIDALEFNMENASIKEQKSLDDKRKLEDRLNKIMKTLRHSIKNLEDDIDDGHEGEDHQKEKN